MLERGAPSKPPHNVVRLLVEAISGLSRGYGASLIAQPPPYRQRARGSGHIVTAKARSLILASRRSAARRSRRRCCRPSGPTPPPGIGGSRSALRGSANRSVTYCTEIRVPRSVTASVPLRVSARAPSRSRLARSGGHVRAQVCASDAVDLLGGHVLHRHVAKRRQQMRCDRRAIPAKRRCPAAAINLDVAQVISRRVSEARAGTNHARQHATSGLVQDLVAGSDLVFDDRAATL
jgi:hypothetical protein